MNPRRNAPSRLQAALLRLNRRQTNALLFGLLVLLVIMLYPPWEHHFRNEVGGIRREPAGFDFISNPPQRVSDGTWAGAHIRWLLWGTEIALICGLTAAFIGGFRDRNPQTRKLLRR